MQSGTTDDLVVTLKTTSAGKFKLPFTIQFYGFAFKQIGVSSDGNIRFGSATKSTSFTPSCLPTSSFAGSSPMRVG